MSIKYDMEKFFNVIDKANIPPINTDKIKWARYQSVSFRNMEIWLTRNDDKALVLMLIPLPTPNTSDPNSEQMYYVICEDIGDPVANSTFEILNGKDIEEFYGLKIKGDSKIHIAHNLKNTLINSLPEIKRLKTLSEIGNNQNDINLLNMIMTKLVVHSLDDKNLNDFNPE